MEFDPFDPEVIDPYAGPLDEFADDDDIAEYNGLTITCPISDTEMEQRIRDGSDIPGLHT